MTAAAAPPSAHIVCPPLPRALGADSPRRVRARAALLRVLFDARGRRLLPDDGVLADALAACGRDDVWWACEANSYGPLYLLPTRQWLSVLVDTLADLRVRSVLEIGAGDGFLSHCLARRRPDLRVVATDSHAWARPEARQNERDRREFHGQRFAGIPMGAQVQRRGAVAATTALQPDLVLASWCPPGTLLERVIRAPSKLVLDISVDGDVCGNGERTWRFEKDFLSGPLEDRALCRLDGDPASARATRCTLYYGKRHKNYGINRRGGLLLG